MEFIVASTQMIGSKSLRITDGTEMMLGNMELIIVASTTGFHRGWPTVF